MNYIKLKTTDGVDVHRVSGHPDYPSKVTITVGGVLVLEASVPPGGHVDLLAQPAIKGPLDIETIWWEI